MIKIQMKITIDSEPKWAPVASERESGWCVVIDGNRMICAIGDALDGESVSAFLPSAEFVDAEWRIDGFAHELWLDGEMRGRLIDSREFVRGEHLHVGADPWHPKRLFPGKVSVEVIDG